MRQLRRSSENANTFSELIPEFLALGGFALGFRSNSTLRSRKILA